MILSSLQGRLILLGFLIVPFISIGELVALFSGQLLSQTNNLTGVFKFSKDLIFFLLILIGVLDYLLRNEISRKAFVFMSIVIVIAAPPLLFGFGNELLLIAAGLRWIIPVILPVFIFKAINKELIGRISIYIFYLFIIHLITQIFQMFFAGAWYGTSAFGLNLRNPGLFLIPNTGAFFTIACLYYSLFISDFSARRKTFIIIASVASIFLTLSGTGLVVLIFVIFFYTARIQMIKWFIFLIPLGMVFLYFFATFLSARDENYVQESGGTRLSIFFDSFMESNLVSTEFGMGTNTAVLLGKGEIMDSTFASLIVNLGYFGFFLGIGLILISFCYAVISKNRELFVFISIFTLFGFTTIIFEVYPANLIMAVLLVYFIKTPSETLKKEVFA